MRLIRQLLTTFIALAICSNAYSETAVCSGSVTLVAQHVPGWAVVGVGNSTRILMCNLDNASFNVTPQGCKAFFALALAAQAENKSAVLYVDNAPTTSCADIPFFHIANTRFFAVQ